MFVLTDRELHSVRDNISIPFVKRCGSDRSICLASHRKSIEGSRTLDSPDTRQRNASP